MDLVTFGEALIRLSPAHDGASPDIAAHVGGAELNVAIGAARLGVQSRWVSRLPDNAMGRFIDATARLSGVDTSVQWTTDGRVGLYFLQEGASPRETSVVYDRAGSSFSRIVPGSLTWPSLLRGARWFHATGISPAVSDGAASASAEALEAAHEMGLTVSYDVNFRVKLWNAERARAVQEPMMKHVDVLIVSEDDARTVFEIREDTAAGTARELANRFDLDAAVVTTRDGAHGVGAVVFSSETTFVAPRYETEVVERVGTGDAFAAALIARRLANKSWDDAARRATAAAALKLSMRGDFFVGQASDIDRLVARAHAKVVS